MKPDFGEDLTSRHRSERGHDIGHHLNARLDRCRSRRVELGASLFEPPETGHILRQALEDHRGASLREVRDPP